MIDWLKRNKIAGLIIVVLLILLAKNYLAGSAIYNIGVRGPTVDMMPVVGQKMTGGFLPPIQEAAPTQTVNRMVVQESSVSMVVADVRQVSDKVVGYAKTSGGYMVSTSFSSPEEAPFASIVVRLPADKLKLALDYFRTLGTRVTSENILGTDATDQYVDLQSRLETLNKTKVKFEEIMTKATAVQDILNVQRELINLQDQIDFLKGQQQYLEQTAKLAKITVYLSTDEFSLPYAPTKQFRPEVIFKQAVRSLVSNARNIAGMLIWIGVYGIIWVPLGIIIYLVWRRRRATQ